ncbi:hypothetical protein G5714_005094 [Onychostoma macrolepis]|uniref:Selenoprotein O n=1 Tax=Onychostoma macrolepis TaxID=369639 RepID=A0A7J6D6J6_9TELE|nr:hypothetical protein G5714_005094 [Onychostoma macrolepis]
MVANQPEVAKQLEKIGRLKELLMINEAELKIKQRDHWQRWVKQYRRRLARDCDKASDPAEVEKERVKSMNSTNPAVVLRNYIAQNAIEAAERGDFSEVQQLLKVLENPYSVSPDLECPVWSAGSGSNPADGNIFKGQEVEENTKRKAANHTHQIPYNSLLVLEEAEQHATLLGQKNKSRSEHCMTINNAVLRVAHSISDSRQYHFKCV